MRKTIVVGAVAAMALSPAAGCRSASQSAEKSALRRTGRLTVAAADTTVVRRRVMLDKPVVRIEYVDSPARYVTVTAERIETGTDTDVRSQLHVAATDSVAAEQSATKTSTPPSAGLTWLGIGAAFIAGLVCSPRSRNRDQTW